MSTELEARIKEQGDLIRQLKLDKAEKGVIDGHVASLQALKAQLPSSSSAKAPASQSKKGSAGKGNAFVLKVPKVSHLLLSFTHIVT